MLTHLTIKDIAKLSGTSVSTVSRVLNNHPDVSEKARAQVMETVEQYRYVPNNSARNLVIRESDCGCGARNRQSVFYAHHQND